MMLATVIALSMIAPATAAEPALPAATERRAQPEVTLGLTFEEPPEGLELRLRRRLSEAGYESHVGEDRITVGVTVRPWSGANASVSGFAYGLRVWQDGELAGEVQPQSCIGCSVDDLAAGIAEHVLATVDGLDPLEPQPDGPATPGSGTSLPEHTNLSTGATVQPVEDHHARSRGLEDGARWRTADRVLVGAGVTSMVLGTAALIAGGILLSKEDEIVPPSENAGMVSVRNFRPPGAALTVMGGVLLVGGSATTAIGAYRRVTGSVAIGGRRGSVAVAIRF